MEAGVEAADAKATVRLEAAAVVEAVARRLGK